MKPQHCAVVAGILCVIACSKAPPREHDRDNDEMVTTGGTPSGGTLASGGSETSGGSSGAPAKPIGGAPPAPEPRYHPPAGFEDCKHAAVKEDCSSGWCKLPPGCFVMGPPEDEWHKGRDHHRVAVTLTKSIEMQQEELTRTEWESITGIPAPGPNNCTDPECPVAMVSWWDAVHAANLLSKQKSLEVCYEPVDCTGTLGVDLACAGVADPDKSVYECEGYRLPTRAEAEYAARAGTISTFYSGDITPYWPDNVCAADPALELIAWYCNNSGGRPHVGGELAPNDIGLYDMIGNLGEWSNEEANYGSSPGGEDPRGNVKINPRRLWFSPQYDAKSWNARTASLQSTPWEGRGPTIGFRLVRTLPD